MTNDPCPYLPHVEGPVSPNLTKRHGTTRGAEYYMDALRYAQGQWIAQKPAQAILQLNKAFSTELPPTAQVFRDHPLPYQALAWILATAVDNSKGFLGNPVRHFQHLATRLSGLNREIRIQRAWICFWIARQILSPNGAFPLDGRQIAREGIFIPKARYEPICPSDRSHSTYLSTPSSRLVSMR